MTLYVPEKVVVSGHITDVSGSSSRITSGWIRAQALRAAGTGLATEESSPVIFNEDGLSLGTLIFEALPGPAILVLLSGAEITTTVDLLIPESDCTLADAYNAAKIADTSTRGELSGMAARAVSAVLEAEGHAAAAEASAQAAANSAANVPPGSVGTEQILDGAVTQGKIDDAAVTSENIAPDAVTTEKLALDAVTSEKIMSGAVTSEKIAPDYAQQASTRSVTLMKDGSSKVITAHKVGRVVHLAIPDGAPGTWSATLSTSSATPLRPALMDVHFMATQPGLNGSMVVILVSGTDFSVQFTGTANTGNIHLTYMSDNSNPLI